jgi:hypothetical protein
MIRLKFRQYWNHSGTALKCLFAHRSDIDTVGTHYCQGVEAASKISRIQTANKSKKAEAQGREKRIISSWSSAGITNN